MKRVKQLSENLINQIAAGEVIERPASVVKELIENSIDAGAYKIEIEISNECRNIRIADNGSGIHKDDLKLAFSRHATSKIYSQDDLWRISSLGFRGEALASISSVAKVSCLSRTADSAVGYKVICENSNIEISETGCSIGTIMDIKDLFYNVPARVKFLKKAQTEFAYIAETIESTALANPHVAITLIYKGNTVIKTSGNIDLKETISEIFSKELLNELFEVNKLDEPFKYYVNGYVSTPSYTRGNRKSYYVFINGRSVKCQFISKSIDNAYRDLIPSGRFPFVVINLSVPPNEIDVNAHPTKKEIRYANTNQVFGFIYAAIKQAVESGLRGTSNRLLPTSDDTFETLEKTENITFVKTFEPDYSQNSISFNFDSFKEKNSYQVEEVQAAVDFYKPIAEIVSPKEFYQFKETEIIEKPKIIGQFHNTYILIEESDGFSIIDQHIAHERTIYEQLKQKRQLASQLIISTQEIGLNYSDFSKLLDNKNLLADFGIEFEEIGNNKIILRKIPQILSNEPHDEIISSILEAMSHDIQSIENEILISISCKSAVKANEKLPIPQMERLIQDWQNTPNNQTCPHGRVISHKISLKEVAGYFGRFEK
ncbi:MAG: DNA mismatch repair endonuclease MutL [bacterium]